MNKTGIKKAFAAKLEALSESELEQLTRCVSELERLENLKRPRAYDVAIDRLIALTPDPFERAILHIFALRNA